MKAKFLLFIHAIFISVSATDLDSFLGYLTPKIFSSRSLMSIRFISDVLYRHDAKVREDFMVIVEGARPVSPFDVPAKGEAKYLNLFDGRILFGDVKVEDILRDEEWNKQTLFLVFLDRDPYDDKLFLQDVRHQNLNLDVIIKDEDIERDFKDDVLPDGKRRNAAEATIRATLYKFWKERILNVIVAKPKKSRVYTYTYFPYTELNCAEHLVPVLTNVWFYETRSFYRDHEFFPEKFGNLFGCPLNVSLVLTPPAILLENGRLSGIEGNILTELFNFINATPNFLFVSNSNKSATAMSYVLNNIKTGLSDIGAGFLIPTKNETGIADGIYVSVNLCLTWAVPNRAKVKNIIAYIFDTFTLSVWQAIVVIMVISAVFSWLLLSITNHKISLLTSLMYIIFSITGEPGPTPKDAPLRVFLMFFICFSILLGEIFQAAMGSNNLIIRPRSQLDTVEDVVDSGLEIKGVEHAIPFFERMPLPKGARVEFGEIEDSLMKVGLQRRTIYIGFKLPMKYYKNVLHPELRRLIHIHRSCLVTYQPFLALRKNSPFSERVSTFVTAMAENGYSNWLYNNFTKYDGRSRRKNKPGEVDMILFYGGLQIWGYGLIVSFVAFVCEIIFVKCKMELGKNKPKNSDGRFELMEMEFKSVAKRRNQLWQIS